MFTKNKQTFYIKFPLGTEVYLLRRDGAVDEGAYIISCVQISHTTDKVHMIYTISPKGYQSIGSYWANEIDLFLTREEALEASTKTKDIPYEEA